MKTLTRFAPSPTGELHLGHAYAAQVAYKLGDSMLLRFEDIDHTRVREPYYAQIEEDLKWLGIDWDAAPWKQSDRLDSYATALDRLRRKEVIYPCFCTRRQITDEISRAGDAPQGPEGPLYPGTCRDIEETTAQQRIDAGESHCWRLDARRASNAVGPLIFSDRSHGVVHVEPQLLGDVILARKDILTSYHLAVVTDDAAQDITLVTRGEDLLPSTHVHRLLQALLDLPEPEYLHHPLILDGEGQRLAKRDQARSIRSLREDGISLQEIQLLLQPSK